MITITRKIQINVANEDKNATWKTLYEYQHIVHHAANLISTHHFCIENIKQFVYLSENIKEKLTSFKIEEEVENKLLTTSEMNTTYQLCSYLFKDKIKMDIITCLNNIIVKTFNKEKKDYYNGKKSLRSYRDTIPIPFSTKAIKYFEYDELKKNYRIKIFDFEFITYLGSDKSNNKSIIDKCLSKEYKLCNSSIKIEKDKKDKKNKIFLLLTCQFDKKEVDIKEDKICEAELSINEPVLLRYDKKEFKIGSKEDYLYKRLQIQAKLQRLQKSLKHNKGGHGRVLKLQALEQFKKKEINYIENKIHNYSRLIIDYCIKNNCGTLKIIDIDQVVEDLKEDENKFILRNWKYYGFLDKIKYKANMVGINVIFEKKIE